MKTYYRRIFSLPLQYPQKIPAYIRLKSARYRLAHFLARKHQHPAPLPQTVAIIPTYRCNLFCSQCGQRGISGFLQNKALEHRELNTELSTEDFNRIISQLAPFRPFLYFTGGEPLLRNDIVELLAYSTASRLATSLNTNCTLLTSVANDLVKSGLDYIYVSLDGPPEINEKIRCGYNSTSFALDGINALVAARRDLHSASPIIELRLTLTKDNQYTLIQTAEFIEQHLSIDSFCILPPIFTTQEQVTAASETMRQEFGVIPACWSGFLRALDCSIDASEIYRQINAIKQRNWSFKFSVHPPLGNIKENYLQYFAHPAEPLGNISNCGALYSFPAILPNGDVAPCASVPDIIAGNLLREDFRSIWNGEAYKKLRRKIKNQLFPTCSRCSHLYQFWPYT